MSWRDDVRDFFRGGERDDDRYDRGREYGSEHWESERYGNRNDYRLGGRDDSRGYGGDRDREDSYYGGSPERERFGSLERDRDMSHGYRGPSWQDRSPRGSSGRDWDRDRELGRGSEYGTGSNYGGSRGFGDRDWDRGRSSYRTGSRHRSEEGSRGGYGLQEGSSDRGRYESERGPRGGFGTESGNRSGYGSESSRGAYGSDYGFSSSRYDEGNFGRPDRESFSGGRWGGDEDRFSRGREEEDRWGRATSVRRPGSRDFDRDDDWRNRR